MTGIAQSMITATRAMLSRDGEGVSAGCHRPHLESEMTHPYLPQLSKGVRIFSDDDYLWSACAAICFVAGHWGSQVLPSTFSFHSLSPFSREALTAASEGAKRYQAGRDSSHYQHQLAEAVGTCRFLARFRGWPNGRNRAKMAILAGFIGCGGG